MGLFSVSSVFFGISKNVFFAVFLGHNKITNSLSMKNRTLFLLAIVMLQSCATPKYSYFFAHHTYETGKKQSSKTQASEPLAIDPQSLLASTSESVISLAPTPPAAGPSATNTLRTNKLERKEIRAQWKKEIKPMIVAAKKNSPNPKAGMDEDLKLAAIFGAVGLVGLIIGGSVFNIIGGIALLIGVVFFVRWLIRQ